MDPLLFIPSVLTRDSWSDVSLSQLPRVGNRDWMGGPHPHAEQRDSRGGQEPGDNTGQGEKREGGLPREGGCCRRGPPKRMRASGSEASAPRGLAPDPLPSQPSWPLSQARPLPVFPPHPRGDRGGDAHTRGEPQREPETQKGAVRPKAGRGTQMGGRTRMETKRGKGPCPEGQREEPRGAERPLPPGRWPARPASTARGPHLPGRCSPGVGPVWAAAAA